MTKIVALNGNIIPGQPNPDIVADLEFLLEQAKSGSLAAFAFCTVYADVKGTGWSGNGGTRDSLHAAIAMLQHRYTRLMLEAGE